MRVLIVTQFYPPDIGGVERHVQSLGKSLSQRGHHVSVATVWHPGQAEEERDGDVHVYRIRGMLQRATWMYANQQRLHPGPWADPEMVAGMRRVVHTVRPDVIHAHNWLVYSLLPIHLNAPVVYTLHDYSLVCVQHRLMRNDEQCDGPALGKCLNCALHHYGPVKALPILAGLRLSASRLRSTIKTFIPVSTSVALGSGLVGSSLPYEVIPNFVPDDVAGPGEDTTEWSRVLPAGEFLLFAGDLRRDKGIVVLLDAYQQLQDRPPLVMIGRPSSDLPATLPQGVQVHEFWPHAGVMEAFRRARVALIPSICRDSSPTVAMEALAAGCPLIASNIGGLPDIIDDQHSGLLVPPGDVTSLRDAMAAVIGSDELRSKLAAGASVSAPRFQASTVVPAIEHAYFQAIAEYGWGGVVRSCQSLPVDQRHSIPISQKQDRRS